MIEIMQRLKDKAEIGRREQENGDIHCVQVPHAVFSEVVPELQEDAIIRAMYWSNEWYCGLEGFTLKPLLV